MIPRQDPFFSLRYKHVNVMAPEVQNGQDFGPPADVWSVQALTSGTSDMLTLGGFNPSFLYLVINAWVCGASGGGVADGKSGVSGF